MKYYLNKILFVTLMLVLSSYGCVKKNNGQDESGTKINQYNRSHQKQGPWEIYSDSLLIAEGSYVNDQPDGLWVYYYPGGQRKEEGHYTNGKREGIWVEWYKDGSLMWKGLWENNKRVIEYTGEKPEINFMGGNISENILVNDSTYRIRIRIPNVPVSHFFVEVTNGSITKEGEADMFMLHTGNDSTLTMAIGYVPDLEFKDFRNLVDEIHFIVK